MKPRHALLPNGMSLWRNGVPFQFAESVGPWAMCRYMDDGAKYTSGPTPPTSGPAYSGINLPLGMFVKTARGESTTPFAVDTSFSKARLMRAGDSVWQSTDYPQCTRNRVQTRLKHGETCYHAVEVCVPNVKGFSRQHNTNRSGQWSGHVNGILPDGRVLFVYVADAKEKFCGYRFEGGNLYLTLYANLEPKDVSKAGVDDLMAYHTGPLSLPLPPEYVALLKTDPLISQVTQEISADQQAAARVDTHISMEFWLSIGEPVYPQAPLVLLDGFESPIWSATKPGMGNAGLQVAERRLRNLHKGWLDDGPRGTFLYGDAPEAKDSHVRRRGGQLHYFQVTAAWHSFLRTRDADWYGLARVLANHVRTSHWLDGQCSHHKGLLPWSGAFSCNDHAVDAEGLLFAWLVDGDAIALEQWNKWAAAYYPPAAGTKDREAVATVRQCDVAYWFTGDAKWADLSTKILAPVLAENERVQQTPNWKKYGAGMPTGVNWHPLAHKKPLGWPASMQTPEGILNVADLAAQGRLEDALPFILHGGVGTGNGPLGEGHVLLQMAAIYDYFRGKKISGVDHHVIYGTSKDHYAHVIVEKPTDAPSELRVMIGCHKAGDIIPQFVYVTDPSGKRTELTAGIKFPTYVLAGNGWYLSESTPRTWRDGQQGAEIRLPFVGPAGRYKVDVGGNGYVKLHAPVSNFVEWQSVTGDFAFAGCDADGNWPVGGIVVGNT